MHPLVQYVAAAPHRMHGLPAAVFIQHSVIYCLMDRSKIDERVFERMEAVANKVVSTLTRRHVPSDRPWGRTSLPLVDPDHPDLLTPVVTRSGITCPLPQQLVSVDLAHALESLTDSTLRHFHPPT